MMRIHNTTTEVICNRALDSDLTEAEYSDWQQHREDNPGAKQLWEQMVQMDHLLKSAPAPVMPSTLHARIMSRVQALPNRAAPAPSSVGWVLLILLIGGTALLLSIILMGIPSVSRLIFPSLVVVEKVNLLLDQGSFWMRALSGTGRTALLWAIQTPVFWLGWLAAFIVIGFDIRLIQRFIGKGVIAS